MGIFNPDRVLENLLRAEIPAISRVSSIFFVEMGATIPSSENLAGTLDLIGISTLATIPNARSGLITPNSSLNAAIIGNELQYLSQNSN
jgi:hypothetical protein